MEIGKDKAVSITYKLQQDNKEGEMIQEVREGDPFVFLFGANQVLPDFEKNLSGKQKGDTFEFAIKSEDSYGARNEEAIVNLPKNIFLGEDGNLLDMVKVGSFVPLKDNQGKTLQGLVLQIEDDFVRVDFNHPMAGINLFFTGLVLDVREATPEEISHGHIHGPGGHQH